MRSPSPLLPLRTLPARLARSIRRGWLVWTAALAVLAITTLALLDEQREYEGALVALTRQQQMLALLLSDELAARLAAVRRDALLVADDVSAGHGPSEGMRKAYPSIEVRSSESAPSPHPPRTMSVLVPSTEGRTVELTVPVAWVMGPSARIERPDELVVLVRPPDEAMWQAADGRQIQSDPLTRAADAGHDTTRLERDEAVALGLPDRRAVAAVDATDTGTLGRWTTAVVASASQERDRWERARGRLLLGVLVPCALIVAFGATALRRQRRELELEKQLALAALVRASDERLARASRAATTGTLAMGIAHEISTPLGVIVGRAEQLAGRVGEDPKAARAVRTIGEQADRITQVVRGFLDLARGGSPSLRPVDPGDVAHGALRLVEHRFVAARVVLVTAVEDDLPTLAGDLRLLEHAVVNLLLNACEASGPGMQVALSVRSADAGVDFVVEDRGAGIRPEDIARATEPFFTTKAAGSGLGLAIVHEIVNIHRGSLVLEPHEGGGTRARIHVPAQGEECSDA
ncbi:sensor histidine kinase [Polyangium sorediatum]|uniref:histidine kinase n=1 Tax=Polyangium sorediatum TaxID=889274 RepID=A0ABT6NVY7_9BACT|nr:ATP-binding protein [Polyangium sorediatum]MDI1432275.1 ATP-binding protein [Polyangium sorediatum]